MFDSSTLENASLQVTGLTFEAQQDVLIDVPALSLGASGITVIMGPNGAGKSLLLRLMHGLLAPSTGEIRCFGEMLTPDVARCQALVFQAPVLLRRSVEANVGFVLRARGQNPNRTPEFLEMVGLGDKARTPARRLSGGEKQRLAIAKALATAPKVLFLDEPTASLDPASTQAIENIVTEAALRNVRIVFVTHDAGQARRLADDVVFMAGGRVAEHAPAVDFFDSPSTVAAQSYLAGRLVPEA